jgi:hypothetical protein
MKRMAAFVLALGALVALGCEGRECAPNEEFVVDEVGTCASAPRQFKLKVDDCRLSLGEPRAVTGLPATGSADPNGNPARDGGFLLYGGDKSDPFRLCRARRVEFRLELSCFDGTGAPACQATLTEPPP